jgi:hypothetical protein
MLANSKLDALPLGRTAREIAALCEKHSVPCGAPEDLVIFLRALDENKHLAMEFWALVNRATERNPAAVTDPKALLAAIVEAVTAQTLAEAESAGSAQRLLVKRTAGMLAGEDVHAPIAPGPFAAARDVSFAVPAPKPEAEPVASPLPPRNRQLRLVLDPDPPPAARDNADSEPRPANAAPFAIPLAAYGDAETYSRGLPRVLAGVLLLAVIGCGWFVLRRNPAVWGRADNAIHTAFASATGGMKTHTATHASTSSPQLVAAPQTQTAQVEAAQVPAPPPPFESGSPRHPASTLQPERTATVAPTPAAGKARATDNAAPDEPQVVVPETLMRQNLISSRIPIAPDPAAAHGIVVLQAVITARGTVEHLRAIQGNPALRHAAIDAASTWRYRPYLLNGTPVDVSTTISVDFSGND